MRYDWYSVCPIYTKYSLVVVEYRCQICRCGGYGYDNNTHRIATYGYVIYVYIHGIALVITHVTTMVSPHVMTMLSLCVQVVTTPCCLRHVSNQGVITPLLSPVLSSMSSPMLSPLLPPMLSHSRFIWCMLHTLWWAIQTTSTNHTIALELVGRDTHAHSTTDERQGSLSHATR